MLEQLLNNLCQPLGLLPQTSLAISCSSSTLAGLDPSLGVPCSPLFLPALRVLIC